MFFFHKTTTIFSKLTSKNERKAQVWKKTVFLLVLTNKFQALSTDYQRRI